MSIVDPITRKPTPSPQESGVRLHRFTVDEYHRMAEAGVFDEDDPIELLHGHLFIKISDTTLPYDRGSKRRDYARNGVARYMIMNVAERQVELYEDPSGPTEAPEYRSHRIYKTGESVPLVSRNQVMESVPVDKLIAVP